MKNEYVTLNMMESEIEENPFVTTDGKAAFYKFICKAIGLDYENIKSIDCRKVNVAFNIQECWYRYAKENNIPTTDLSMLLLMSGPKAMENIKDNTVELEDGAIEY